MSVYSFVALYVAIVAVFPLARQIYRDMLTNDVASFWVDCGIYALMVLVVILVASVEGVVYIPI